MTSKALQTDSALCHTFEGEVTFWLFETFKTKIWHLKNCMELNASNKIFTAPCFRERSHFWLKSNLQSSNFVLNLDTFLWTSNYTILCSWRRIYSYIRHSFRNRKAKSSLSNVYELQLKCSRYTIQCVVFLTTKQALRYTGTLVHVPHVPVQQGTAAGVCGRSRLVWVMFSLPKKIHKQFVVCFE